MLLTSVKYLVFVGLYIVHNIHIHRLLIYYYVIKDDTVMGEFDTPAFHIHLLTHRDQVEITKKIRE